MNLQLKVFHSLWASYDENVLLPICGRAKNNSALINSASTSEKHDNGLYLRNVVGKNEEHYFKRQKFMMGYFI